MSCYNPFYAKVKTGYVHSIIQSQAVYYKFQMYFPPSHTYIIIAYW